MTISPIVAAWVTDGSNDEQHWWAARSHIAHYTTRMGDFYWQMFERHGYEAEVAAARAAAAERDQEATVAAISDRMVRDLAVIGRPEEIREQLQERSDRGAEVQLLQHLPWDPAVSGPILETLLR